MKVGEYLAFVSERIKKAQAEGDQVEFIRLIDAVIQTLSEVKMRVESSFTVNRSTTGEK